MYDREHLVATVRLTAHSDSIAASIAGNITLTQFLSWNPNVMGLCDAVTDGQYICIR